MPLKGLILTGHRPTGPRHIGHLVGTLQTWAGLQDSYQCLFLVADLHVLTTDYTHPQTIQANTIEMVKDWLAVGIDPHRSLLILQSAIPEHAQLSILLSMLAKVSRLTRVPTYKDQVKQLNLQPSLGLLAYPVLQAADILIYRATHVPVGADQLPHLELAREIARRFNQLYVDYFPEPQAILSDTPALPGLDNRTMHTSYGNAIFIKDSPEETTRKIMSMFTDPTRIHASDPGHIENNPLFAYLQAFDADKEEIEEFKALYQRGKIGDVDLKHHLAGSINEYLAPIRERRSSLGKTVPEIHAILRAGTEQARALAQETLRGAQELMGLRLATEIRKTNFQPVTTRLTGTFC